MPASRDDIPDVPERASRTDGGGSGVTGLRAAFVAGWIVVQIALIFSAKDRPDGAFGFRMFSESSTIETSLFRELRGSGERVSVQDGTWVGHDDLGLAQRFSWYDRVQRPELRVFDREIAASYGAAAQRARWTAALADVARHVRADVDTARLVLRITTRMNGRRPETVEVTRDLGGAGD